MARELILKLGKKITDRVDVKLGMTQLDETSPEYYGLASVVTDEMAELALAMKVRVPTTPAEIGKKVGKVMNVVSAARHRWTEKAFRDIPVSYTVKMRQQGFVQHFNRLRVSKVDRGFTRRGLNKIVLQRRAAQA